MGRVGSGRAGSGRWGRAEPSRGDPRRRDHAVLHGDGSHGQPVVRGHRRLRVPDPGGHGGLQREAPPGQTFLQRLRARRGESSGAGDGDPQPAAAPCPVSPSPPPAPAVSEGFRRLRAVAYLPSRVPRAGPGRPGTVEPSAVPRPAPRGTAAGLGFFTLPSPRAGAPEWDTGTEVPAAIPGRPSLASLSWRLALAAVGPSWALWFWLRPGFQMSLHFPTNTKKNCVVHPADR